MHWRGHIQLALSKEHAGPGSGAISPVLAVHKHIEEPSICVLVASRVLLRTYFRHKAHCFLVCSLRNAVPPVYSRKHLRIPTHPLQLSQNTVMPKHSIKDVPIRGWKRKRADPQFSDSTR